MFLTLVLNLFNLTSFTCVDYDIYDYDVFRRNREALWQQVVQYATVHPCTDPNSDEGVQLIRCSTLLLLRCLHEYTTALSPGL